MVQKAGLRDQCSSRTTNAVSNDEDGGGGGGVGDVPGLGLLAAAEREVVLSQTGRDRTVSRAEHTRWLSVQLALLDLATAIGIHWEVVEDPYKSLSIPRDPLFFWRRFDCISFRKAAEMWRPLTL